MYAYSSELLWIRTEYSLELVNAAIANNVLKSEVDQKCVSDPFYASKEQDGTPN